MSTLFQNIIFSVPKINSMKKLHDNSEEKNTQIDK